MPDRISEHPILNFSFEDKNSIRFRFEGSQIEACQGDTIAAALLNAGVDVFGHSTTRQRPRGLFCAIGKCSSCLMTVDGIPNVRTCITTVQPGMEVQRQERNPSLQTTPSPKGGDTSSHNSCEIVVVGGGPAGLKAAMAAAKAGAQVILIDENPQVGGQLVKQTHKFFGSSRAHAGRRGIDIGKEFASHVRQHDNIDVITSTTVVGIYSDNKLGLYRQEHDFSLLDAEAVVIATGANENMLTFDNNDLPGVYGAGGVQTIMNSYGIEPGNRALVVGAGNVGLIVAYQLIQAGTEVLAVVEAKDKIGGYFVHAAKIRRQGVPLLTSHTVVEAHGGTRLTEVVTAVLDQNWNPVPGTKKDWSVDLLALAVGLTPNHKLADQAGCNMKYVPRLGGEVPVRDEDLQTTKNGVFVAGDLCGVEEATTAVLEGQIAGLGAASELGYSPAPGQSTVTEARQRLSQLREGPINEELRKGLKEVYNR